MEETFESLDIFGENTSVLVLQFLVVSLAIGIIVMLYMEKSNVNSLGEKMDAFKCPETPACPKCPACNCTDKGCPDCVCPENSKCPKCPTCPDVNTSCPKCKTISPDDIADAIFPGRNKGLTSHGQYFPLDGLGEGSVEPAWSPVTNLMPNYVGGDGAPAAISFADQKLLSDKSSVALAVKKQPALATTQGVFTKGGDKPLHDTIVSDKQPSKVVAAAAPSQEATGLSTATDTPTEVDKQGFIVGVENKLSSIF